MSKQKTVGELQADLAKYEGQLPELQKKVDTKENQIKAKKAEIRKALRAEEAHKKIEIGGVAIAVLRKTNPDIGWENFDLHRFQKYLEDQETRGHYYSRAMGVELPDNSSRSGQIEHSDTDHPQNASSEIRNSNSHFSDS